MNLVLEVILVIFKVIWLWLVAIFKAIVPAKFQNPKDVRGQVVLITGAGSGLGRLMSLRFALLGCKIVLWDINDQGNQETVRLVESLGGQVHAYSVDLSKRDKIYQAADKVKAEVGNVDILVNNAGIVTGKKFMDCPDVLIEKTMEVNTNAHFWTTKAFLPNMLKNNHGHIVSIASSAGFFGVSGLSDYCASKFGAVGFDESLRSELVKQGMNGVHTTIVCPYFINTGMFTGVKSRFPNVLPILEPEYVVDKIMDAVLTNQHLLMLPRVVYLFLFLKGIMPVSVSESLSTLFGMNKCMDEFVGRAKTN